MAINLARPKHRSLSNPSLLRLFSTNDNNNPSPLSSYVSDVKASLKQQQPQNPNPNLPPLRKPTYRPPSTSTTPTKVTSFEEIRKNLSEFRRRSAVPNPSETNPNPNPPSQPLSFQELYKRNVISKSNEEDKSSSSSAGAGGTRLPFEAIRESLRQMRAGNAEKRDAMSLNDFKNSLKLKPDNVGRGNVGSRVIGGTEELPLAVFGREMKGEGRERDEAMKTEFVKMYSYEDLGDKLRKLRPEGVKDGEGWFSLGELNERLGKLREIEEKENQSMMGVVPFKDLRDSLLTMKMSDELKLKKSSIQRLDILNQLGGTPNFMLHPPKEQLVEKYFHPDNMSSEEKMKIELAKVRDEFKMSESDCGSARVQVAQLTTKIKHLSSVLHKKDKHSRKGLVAMVQRRKKLLKYLRKTDWESYCIVLSKLGLRDNPDYKN